MCNVKEGCQTDLRLEMVLLCFLSKVKFCSLSLNKIKANILLAVVAPSTSIETLERAHGIVGNLVRETRTEREGEKGRRT